LLSTTIEPSGWIAQSLKVGSAKVGWETLLNKASPTFRELPDKAKARLDERKAIAPMLGEPTMIKRPVLDVGGALLVGFKAEEYGAAFG
jgi:arsenate reductase (glutaredoxin)